MLSDNYILLKHIGDFQIMFTGQKSLLQLYITFCYGSIIHVLTTMLLEPTNHISPTHNTINDVKRTANSIFPNTVFISYTLCLQRFLRRTSYNILHRTYTIKLWKLNQRMLPEYVSNVCLYVQCGIISQTINIKHNIIQS